MISRKVFIPALKIYSSPKLLKNLEVEIFLPPFFKKKIKSKNTESFLKKFFEEKLFDFLSYWSFFDRNLSHLPGILEGSNILKFEAFVINHA